MPSEFSGPAEEQVLREVFRRILERNLAFCLVASDGINERIFYFAIGGIRVIASGPRSSASLGEAMLESGVITQGDFDRVDEATGHDPHRFGEVALKLGVCSAGAMQEAVTLQVETELLDLFFWDCAEVSLVEGQPPKSFYEGRFQTASLTCDVSAMLKGVLERVDVWRQTVARLPGGRDAFEMTEKGEPDLRGRFGRLLRHLDGAHTLADATEKAQMRRVPAFEYVMLALQEGKIRRAVGSSAQRIGREQMLRDVALLEQALHTRVDATFVRRRLARTLEQVGELPRAAAQWRSLGDLARKTNDLDRALLCYSECVRVLPTDFATRELILEIYRHRKEFPQVVAHGRPLAELFVKHNLLNRAKQLLIQLVQLEPSDTGLRRTLILVLIGLGERELALKYLRELARLLEGRKALAGELKDVYVRILALDPNDKTARSRLDQLTGLATQRRVVKIAAGATAGVVLAAGALSYLEGRARAEINTAIAEARDMILVKDVAGAHTRLNAALDRHRSSGGAKSLQAFLAQVERIQREQMARAARRVSQTGIAEDPAEVAIRRERRESEARDLLREASDLAAKGRSQEAHKVFDEVLRTHAGTVAASTAKVPLALTVRPAGARVTLDGVAVGRGSVMVEYCPSKPSVVEIEADGFARKRIEIEGLQAGTMSVWLHRPLRWSAVFDAAVETSPIVGEGLVIVAGRDRFLTALSATDGRQIWRTPLGLYAEAGAAPVVTGEGVVVATESGEALSARRSTGEIVWRRAVGAAVQRPMATNGASVVVTPADGSFACLDALTGEPRWSLPERSAAGGAPVLLGTDDLAWIDSRGTVRACAIGTGKPVARATVAAVLRGTPTLGSDDRMWAFAEDESLRLLNASTGTVLRRFPAPRAFLDVPPATDGDRAFHASQDGYVSAVRADGEVLFRKRLEQPAPAGVAVSGGRLYVGGAGGILQVLDAANGEELWRFDAGARISARPVVAGGTVYVVTAAGRIFALEE